MRNKKFLFMICMLLFFMVDVAKAKTYDVELVKDSKELNNSTADNYLLVATSSGVDYAWVNGAFDSTGKNLAQTKNNAITVNVNEGLTQITIDDEYASYALWTFGISKNTVKKNSSAYTLMASNDLYTGDLSNRNQIEFSFKTKKESSNPTGFVYTNSGYPITLTYANATNGNAKISQDVNDTNYYVQFSSNTKNFYVSDSESSSKSIRVYKVIEKNSAIDKFDAVEEGKLNFSKTQTAHKSFTKTGVYQIDLALSAKILSKDIDVVFVLDYSNSMDTEAKINALTSNTNSLIEQLLKDNPKNRIGIVKFANVALFAEDTYNLGLSSDINAIKKLLDAEVGEIPGGTNYTDAFKVANELLSRNYVPNRDQMIIFITDGAPTIYNRTKYSVFGDTNDNKEGAYADNWSNYILNYDLAPVTALKQKGIEIITVGVGTDVDIPITSTGSFVMKPEVTQSVLKKIATNENDAYFVSDYDSLYENLKDKFVTKLYIHDTVVHDFVNKDYKLVVDDFDSYKPYVEIKRENGEVVERIDFDNGNAYSSLLEDGNIIIDDAGNKILKGIYFDYNFDTKDINWKVNKLIDDKIMLTYFIEPEKEQNSYKQDDGAIDGTVKVNYKDYDDSDKEVSYLFEVEKKVENPKTGVYSSTLYIVLALISTIAIILSLKKFAHNK